MHNDIILNLNVINSKYLIKLKAMDPKCKLHSSFVEHVSIKIFGSSYLPSTYAQCLSIRAEFFFLQQLLHTKALSKQEGPNVCLGAQFFESSLLLLFFFKF